MRQKEWKGKENNGFKVNRCTCNDVYCEMITTFIQWYIDSWITVLGKIFSEILRGL